ATGVIPDVIPERRPSATAPQLRASSGLFGSLQPNVVRRATQATRPDCSPPSVRYDRFASANSGRSVSAFKRGCEVRPEGRPRVIQNFVRRYFNSQRTELYKGHIREGPMQTLRGVWLPVIVGFITSLNASRAQTLVSPAPNCREFTTSVTIDGQVQQAT